MCNQIVNQNDPIQPKLIGQLHFIDLPAEIRQRHLPAGNGPGDADAAFVDELHRVLGRTGEEVLYDLNQATASLVLGDAFVDLLEPAIEDREPAVRPTD